MKKKNKNQQKKYDDIDENHSNLIDSSKFASLVDPEFKLLSPQNQIDKINELLDEALKKFKDKYKKILKLIDQLRKDYYIDMSTIKEYIKICKRDMHLNKYLMVQPEEEQESIFIKQYDLHDLFNESIYNDLPNSKMKSIFTLCLSPIIDFESKIKLLFSNSNLFKNRKFLLIKGILPQFKSEIETIKQNIFENLPQDQANIIKDITEFPSEAAFQGLDFLTPEREEELISTTDLNIKLIKMIYACLGEDLPEKDSRGRKIIFTAEEKYQDLFKKYGVDSIKEIFTNFIYKKIFEDAIDDDIEFLANVIQEITPYRDIITENLVKQMNNPFSFVAQSLDEVDTFISNLLMMDDDLKERYKTLKKIKVWEQHLNYLKQKTEEME